MLSKGTAAADVDMMSEAMLQQLTVSGCLDMGMLEGGGATATAPPAVSPAQKAAGRAALQTLSRATAAPPGSGSAVPAGDGMLPAGSDSSVPAEGRVTLAPVTNRQRGGEEAGHVKAAVQPLQLSDSLSDLRR